MVWHRVTSITRNCEQKMWKCYDCYSIKHRRLWHSIQRTFFCNSNIYQWYWIIFKSIKVSLSLQLSSSLLFKFDLFLNIMYLLSDSKVQAQTWSWLYFHTVTTGIRTTTTTRTRTPTYFFSKRIALSLESHQQGRCPMAKLWFNFNN